MKTEHILAIFIFVLFCKVFLGNGITQDDTQWKLPEGAKARLSNGEIKSISFSPDETRIAVASSTSIWIYDAHTGNALTMLHGHEAGGISVAFSPDSKTLASGSKDGTIRLWDTTTGNQIISFDSDSSTALAFSVDGKHSQAHIIKASSYGI